MADRDANPMLQPAECWEHPDRRPWPMTPEQRALIRAANGERRCPYLKETGGGFEGEQYGCEVCGYRFYLDYEEMK